MRVTWKVWDLAGGQGDQAGVDPGGRVQPVREQRQVLRQRGRRDGHVVPVLGRRDRGRVRVACKRSAVSSTKYQYAVTAVGTAHLEVLGARVDRSADRLWQRAQSADRGSTSSMKVS